MTIHRRLVLISDEKVEVDDEVVLELEAAGSLPRYHAERSGAAATALRNLDAPNREGGILSYVKVNSVEYRAVTFTKPCTVVVDVIISRWPEIRPPRSLNFFILFFISSCVYGLSCYVQTDCGVYIFVSTCSRRSFVRMVRFLIRESSVAPRRSPSTSTLVRRGLVVVSTSLSSPLTLGGTLVVSLRSTIAATSILLVLVLLLMAVALTLVVSPALTLTVMLLGRLLLVALIVVRLVVLVLRGRGIVLVLRRRCIVVLLLGRIVLILRGVVAALTGTVIVHASPSSRASRGTAAEALLPGLTHQLLINPQPPRTTHHLAAHKVLCRVEDAGARLLDQRGGL